MGVEPPLRVNVTPPVTARTSLQQLADRGDHRWRGGLVGQQLALPTRKPDRDHDQQQADRDTGERVGDGRAGHLVQRKPGQREADADDRGGVLPKDSGRGGIGGPAQVRAERQPAPRDSPWS